MKDWLSMTIAVAMKIDCMILVQVVSVSVLVFFILRRAMALIPMKMGFRMRKTKAM